MKITQVNLKTQGDTKNFQILKSISAESPIDNWETIIEVTKNEKNNYEFELSGQKFKVFNIPKISSKNEKFMLKILMIQRINLFQKVHLIIYFW